MKLWKISQDENDGYDTYDSAVVAAETEQDAVWTYPGSYGNFMENGKVEKYSPWYNVEFVTAELLGEAKEGIKAGVILASFNAG